MKTTNILRLLFVAMTLLLSGCYPGISGKVVDGVSGKPIEGAVVLAQWTKSGGLPGLTHHSVYKITETETNKEGAFSISGVYNPFVDPPQMVIYKKGYVPWRNDMTFEKMKIDPDNINWQDDITYKMDHWKEGYSKERLSLFLGSGIIGSANNITPKYSAIESIASQEAQNEVDTQRNSKKY